MFMLNKRVQKLIAKGTALIITLTVMIGAAWAILSTEKIGLSVSVSFDSAVTAKVYISTNSSTAGAFRQISPTVNEDPLTDFDISKSALIVDTYLGTPSQKTTFEGLGTGNGLKCDANGEMEFYIYVENYSTTENVYYRANIDFVGAGEQSAPFSIITNPSYESAGLSAETGTPTKSLLTFKIKSTMLEGLNANALQIEIEMHVTLSPFWFISGPYTTGNYTGLYYLDYGEYPQSLYGTTQPTGTIYNSTSGYYENLETGKKYKLSNSNYYNVDPVRWLIIGNGGNFTGLPNKNFDNLADNQLLLLSEKSLVKGQYHTTETNITWGQSTLFQTSLPTLRNQIFNATEQNHLGNIYEYNNSGVNIYSKLSILSYDMSYKYSDYLTTNTKKCTGTSYNSNNYYDYWLRQTTLIYGNSSDKYKGYANGLGHTIDATTGQCLCCLAPRTYISIRPCIVLDLV